MAYTPSEIVNVNKTITLTGNGAIIESIFSLIGIVRIHEIYGVVTEAVDSTTLQKVGLILYETTPTTVEITDIGTGVDCSGTDVGSLLIRTAVVGSTSALTYKKADVCSSIELMYEGGGYGLVVVQRNGVTTNIKVSFTGDVNTDVDIQWFIKYTPLSSGSKIIAV